MHTVYGAFLYTKLHIWSWPTLSIRWGNGPTLETKTMGFSVLYVLGGAACVYKTFLRA